MTTIDPVKELTEVTRRAVVSTAALSELRQYLATNSPSSETIAAALAEISLGASQGLDFQRGSPVLNGLLQLQLTREHVQAQERMGAAADKLARAANRLTVIGIGLGVVAVAIPVLQAFGVFPK